VVGERWTLLVLRELFAGPKRFTDLLEGLPGVGTAILTERVRQLERNGLVSRRRLSRPAPALVYELTGRGRALDPVLSGLAQWGAVYLAGNGGLATRPRWLLQGLAATAPTPARGIEPVTNFVLDGEECHLFVAGKRLVARDGLSPEAHLAIRGTAKALHKLATSPKGKPVALQGLTVDGDRRSANRLLHHLVVGAREAAAAGTSNPVRRPEQNQLRLQLARQRSR
jgi:DNA-binding HxlR family transcriptional regulator